MRDEDEIFMSRAIRLSRLAAEHGNEPFGAVLVRDGKIVAESENRIYTLSDPTYHAEMGLVRDWFSAGNEDMSDCTLYSSCEPCFMCSGALVWARLKRLVYAASDLELGEILHEKGSPCSETVFSNSSHSPEVRAGVLAKESLEVLKDYFSSHKKG